MKRTIGVLLALIGVAAPALAQSNDWTIDPAHTAAQFAVRHMLVSTVRGQLGPVTGTVKYDGKDVKSIEVNATIDVTKLDTRVEGRDNDLRSPNFFDTATYPTMTFKSKRVEPVGPGHFKLIGDLTMKGNTREVTLDVEGPSPPLKMGANTRMGASATTTINRKDFGLTWNKLLETGGAVVSDEVQVQIDIELTQKGAAAGK